MRRKRAAVFMCVAMMVGALSGCGSSGSTGTDAESKELSILYVGAGTPTGEQAVCDAAEEELGITIEIEKLPGGEEGDNLVKTRLASGDMADILCYSTGSLFAALNPGEYFVDLTGEGFMDKVDETFIKTVTSGDGVYGIPNGFLQTGAVLYNKDVYEKYNLEIPHTWDEFLQNCQILKDNGETAVLGTFAETWTAQVPFLGDNYNVLAAEPDFAEGFEAGNIKYAENEAGLRSFEKMEDLIPFYNEDYLATSYDDGCEMLAEGQAAQWITLSGCLDNIHSLCGEDVNKIGCFGVPGDDADNHGLTVWEPNAFYINNQSENIDLVKEFFNYYISDEGLDAYAAATLPGGPSAVKGYELPENTPAAVIQMQEDYLDTGKTALAMEYLTAVKGASCASICQELGSGQTTALEAAQKYDADCLKQAVQLGLDWE